MGQVPSTNQHLPCIGIIGNGKAARHLAFYLQGMGYPLRKWDRSQPAEKLKLLCDCKVILLAIPDSQVDGFISRNSFLRSTEVVHLSGALTTSIRSLHPLVSFGPTFFDLNFYKEISFVTESEAPLDFKTLFPNLPNPVFKIPRSLKAKYHAYCVASNNFTTMLWQKFFLTLQNQFAIKPEAAKALFKSTFTNINNDWQRALTGPFSRGDRETIQRNIESLEGDALQKIYRAFDEAFIANSKEKISYVYLDPGEIAL